MQNNQTVYRNLLMVKGLGPLKTKKICNKLGIAQHTLLEHVTKEKKENLNKELMILRKNNTIETGLSTLIHENILKLISIHSQKGLRHKLGYPVRGQRTRSNAKTAKKLNKKLRKYD